MPSHEYRIVPAPRRAPRVKGARTPEERFARAVEDAINALAREGWEYVRTDTMPCEQRQGWFSGRVTVSQTLLVFRRVAAAEAAPLLPEAAAPRRPSAMPPPEAPPVAAPAAVPPRVAAQRFTPAPPPRPPANRPAAATPPLSLVEPPARPAGQAAEPAADRDPRLAAE
jgi:hypothetical protein